FDPGTFRPNFAASFRYEPRQSFLGGFPAPVKTGAFWHLGCRPPSRGKEMMMSIEQRPCQRCGKEIPERRLQALPSTRLCVDCSQDIGGDFETYVIPENTGKPGSMKKNYGS